MEIALNTVVAASPSSPVKAVASTSTSAQSTSLAIASIAFTSSSRSGGNSVGNNNAHEYQSDNVNGLASLASLTLQKVLNINNINNGNGGNNFSNSNNQQVYQQQINTAIENHKENILLGNIKKTTSTNNTLVATTTTTTTISTKIIASATKTATPAATTTTTATTTKPTHTSTNNNSNSNKKNSAKNQKNLTTTANSALQTPTPSTSKSSSSSATTTKTTLALKTSASANSITSSAKAKSASPLSTTKSATAILLNTNNNNNKNNNANGKNNNNLASSVSNGNTKNNAAVVVNNVVNNQSKIPSDILDDLASRFIINVPDMELSNMIRVCFQIELAHWFYLDFFCNNNNEDQSQQQQKQPHGRKLHPINIKFFAIQLFKHIPFLRKCADNTDQILADWKNYKLSVPTYGAILISEDLNHCLLVQSYFAKSSWGFPKGKINENEDPVHCATREVYEETGFDITEIIDENDFVDTVINYQYTRLYIVRNVPMDTKFSPRTRNEIKCCEWFRIDALPVCKNDAISKARLGMNGNSFFMILPFVKRLKKWVNEQRSGVEIPSRRRKCSASVNGNGGYYSSNGNGQQSPKSISPNHLINNNAKTSNKKNNKHNGNNNNNTNNQKDAQVAEDGANTSASKRQRHKSMGDLDGVKLNNLSTNSTADETTVDLDANLTTPTDSNVGGNSHNSKNSNNRQRATNKENKIGAAGLTVNKDNQTPKTTPTSIGGAANNSANIKRQLFHSQSQNDAQQLNETVINTFDLIRKEKQQLKAAAKPAQKQQNKESQQQQNGRVRVKTQGEKNNALQQQTQQQPQQQKYNNLTTNNNSNNNNNKQQQAKSNNNNNNNNSKTNNTNNTTSNAVTSSPSNKQIAIISTQLQPQQQQQQQPDLQQQEVNDTKKLHQLNTPTTGLDLIAMIAAAAQKQQIQQQQRELLQHEQQLRPRPASVSINVSASGLFEQMSAVSLSSGAKTSKNSSFITSLTGIMNDDIAAGSAGYSNADSLSVGAETLQKLERMASGTNLRQLKRATSHQPASANASAIGGLLQQQPGMAFQPNLPTWTNFSFTKNFIANVFC